MSGLIPLVADILRLPVEEVGPDTGPATTAAWTSLRHVEIVVRVQETYGVRLSGREARACRSVGALDAILAQKGVR